MKVLFVQPTNRSPHDINRYQPMKRKAAKTKNVNILWGLSRALQEQDGRLRGPCPAALTSSSGPNLYWRLPYPLHPQCKAAAGTDYSTCSTPCHAGRDRREKINVSRAQGCSRLFTRQTPHSWSAFHQWKQQYLSGYAPQLLITHLSWALLIP